jgi:hypothetical protein
LNKSYNQFQLEKTHESRISDVAKAFDKLYHQGLFHKVIAAGFPIGLAIPHAKQDLEITVEIVSSEHRITPRFAPGIVPLLYFYATLRAASTTAFYVDDTAVPVRHSSAEFVTQLTSCRGGSDSAE